MIPPVWQERIGAGAVLGVGLVLVSEGLRLPRGHLASFGPGLFPLIIGTIVCMFAFAILAMTWRAKASGAPDEEEQEDGWAWRPIIFVGAGMLAFAELIRPFGLVPATMALVLLASLGEQRIRPVTTVLLAVALSATGVAIFIWGLGLALVPWRF